MYMDLCGIILAGGRSRRMGTDKALIQFGDRTILERTIDVVSGICGTVHIVGGRIEHGCFGAELVADEVQGAGPLGGIVTALATFPASHLLVVGCDMPFLSETLLQAMHDQPTDYTALVPFDGSRMHPLHAIYAPSALTPLRDRVLAGELRVVQAVQSLRPRLLGRDWIVQFDPFLRSLDNLNTVEELEEARHTMGTTAPTARAGR